MFTRFSSVIGCLFFKQKTAYEMRISDWSSDVCSSDLPPHRGAFGEDRDPALLLQVIGIHCSFLDTLVVAEGPRLAEQLVDESGFSMIDVGDNGDIAQRHEIGRASCRERVCQYV